MATLPSKLPLFHGQDYDDWGKQMKAFLRSHDLWSVVVEIDPEAEDFKERNASALRFIREAMVSNNIYPEILNLKYAADAWEALHSEFIINRKRKRILGDSDWVIDIEVMLGCLDKPQAKACSISRVSDKLREAKEDAYSPKVVSIGPFHRGTGSDSEVILMDRTKVCYMLALLNRAAYGEQEEKLKSCSKAIRWLDPAIRASYGGEIKLKPEELAKIMVVDGCFLLELLLKLYDHVTHHRGYPSKLDDKTLSDLTMLENQIPLIVLQRLHRELSEGEPRRPFPSFTELARSLFDYHGNGPDEVSHFLHLMHLSSICSNNESDAEYTMPKEATQELRSCARMLQASGIKIQAGPPATANIALGLHKFVDKFDLNIKFDEDNRTLTIPPLRVKEGTEVKWRNFIAFEQSGIDDIGYRFTSYAYFFNGLICSVPDIELLRTKKVIIVDDPKIKDKDLLEMFRTIVDGVEKMDSRYSQLCEDVETFCSAILNPIIWGHYCWRVLVRLIH